MCRVCRNAKKLHRTTVSRRKCVCQPCTPCTPCRTRAQHTPATLQQHSSNTPVNEWKIRPKPTSGGAPTHLHTLHTCIPAENRCGAGLGRAWRHGLEARPSEPRPRSPPHINIYYIILYTLHTILFCKRYAECAEYAETQKSSTEPRFHGASASASSAHPAHLDISIERAKSSTKYHLNE